MDLPLDQCLLRREIFGVPPGLGIGLWLPVVIQDQRAASFVTERWSVVTDSDTLLCAGRPPRALTADNVTYLVGPLATLVIVQAGDRAWRQWVQNLDSLELKEPFPEAVDKRLSGSKPPLLGFVRMAKGYLPLEKLRNPVSRHKPISIDGNPWPCGGTGGMTWCLLRLADRPPFDALDQVRRHRGNPLPVSTGLRFLPHDPVAAVRDFVAGWFADIPPGDDGLDDRNEALPEPLLAFYRAAAGRREVFGLHNEIYPAGECMTSMTGGCCSGRRTRGSSSCCWIRPRPTRQCSTRDSTRNGSGRHQDLHPTSNAGPRRA